MKRALTRHVDRGVRRLGFCSPATHLTVLLILAAAGQLAAQEVATEKMAWNQSCLRYLPDGCRIVGQIDLDAFLETDFGRQMAASVRNSAQFAPLDLQLEQVDRAVFGARAFSEGHDAQCVYALFCKQPVAQPAVMSPWVAEQVAGHKVWTTPGKNGQALCVVEERIVLIGVPKMVRDVLLRNEPAELPPELDRACQQLSGDSDATITFLATDEVVAKSFGIPDVSVLSTRVDAVNVEIDFGDDWAMRVAAICPDEAAAQQLNGMGLALWALVHSQGIENQDPKVRRVLRSLECHVEGPILNVSMILPFEMILVANGPTPGTLLFPVQPAAHAGPLLGSSVCLPTSPPQAYTACPTPSAGYSPYASAPATTIPSPASKTPPSLAQPCAPTGSWDSPGPWTSDPYAPHPPHNPACAAAKPRPLPVIELSDVIRLSEAGVDEEIIRLHLGKHRLDHALTTDEVIQLTEAGVSTTVIKVMMAYEDEPTPTPPVSYPAPPN
jgi:hypothetical protein